MKFLVDECLGPRLAALARERSFGPDQMEKRFAALPARLISRLATGVTSRGDGGRVHLQLRFEH